MYRPERISHEMKTWSLGRMWDSSSVKNTFSCVIVKFTPSKKEFRSQNHAAKNIDTVRNFSVAEFVCIYYSSDVLIISYFPRMGSGFDFKRRQSIRGQVSSRGISRQTVYRDSGQNWARYFNKCPNCLLVKYLEAWFFFKLGLANSWMRYSFDILRNILTNLVPCWFLPYYYVIYSLQPQPCLGSEYGH